MKNIDKKERSPVLEVEGLKTHFKTDEGIVKAVNGVSFKLYPGERIGIVGESGSGKSVTNLSIMKLIPSPPGKIVEGQVFFKDNDIMKMSKDEVRNLRGDSISMIFQDPMTSLNPFLRISTQLLETIILHQQLPKKEALELAIHMLSLVGIPNPSKRVHDYPHQFSGGMRQRVMIAMALSCKPEILIADEPTTALDVTVQSQILELIQKLTEEMEPKTALILITHDLGVVAGLCEHIYVMYAGLIVEAAPTEELFADPKHPYTVGLMHSVPRLDETNHKALYAIPGQPPQLVDLPDRCPFYPRCERAIQKCKEGKTPPLFRLGESRVARCWLHERQQGGKEKDNE